MGTRIESLVGDWIGLLRLARGRFRSSADYQRFQIYQGRLVAAKLVELGICFSGSKVLDLGCGKGGYSYVMSKAGAEVVSLDFRRPRASLSEPFLMADALRTPFPSRSFPFVFCASLIEHVAEPVALTREISRLLTPDGAAYLSFPPFYSPVGGHQFKPFHLLGERWALRLSGRAKRSYAECYGDWGLYPVTIQKAREAISEAGLQITDESTRFLPINTARIPALGEFLTWHVEFLVTPRR